MFFLFNFYEFVLYHWYPYWDYKLWYRWRLFELNFFWYTWIFYLHFFLFRSHSYKNTTQKPTWSMFEFLWHSPEVNLGNPLTLLKFTSNPVIDLSFINVRHLILINLNTNFRFYDLLKMKNKNFVGNYWNNTQKKSYSLILLK